MTTFAIRSRPQKRFLPGCKAEEETGSKVGEDGLIAQEFRIMEHVNPQKNNKSEADRKRFLSPGLLVGIVANCAGAIAGAVFFTSEYGGRFRGMEPEAKLFMTLGLLSAALGLIVGLPTSIYDLVCKRWAGGLIGFFLAFTPIFIAFGVSELAAFLLNLTWD